MHAALSLRAAIDELRPEFAVAERGRRLMQMLKSSYTYLLAVPGDMVHIVQAMLGPQRGGHMIAEAERGAENLRAFMQKYAVEGSSTELKRDAIARDYPEFGALGTVLLDFPGGRATLSRSGYAPDAIVTMLRSKIPDSDGMMLCSILPCGLRVYNLLGRSGLCVIACPRTLRFCHLTCNLKFCSLANDAGEIIKYNSDALWGAGLLCNPHIYVLV